MSVSIAISKRRTPKARHKLQIESIGFTAFWTFSGAGTCCGYQSAGLSIERERKRETTTTTTTNRSLSDSVAVKSGFPLLFLFQVSVLAKEQLLEVFVSPPPSGLWDSNLFGCKGGCTGFLNPLGSGGTCFFSCFTKEKVSVTSSIHKAKLWMRALLTLASVFLQNTFSITARLFALPIICRITEQPDSSSFHPL